MESHHVPGTDIIVMGHRSHKVTVQEMSEDNYEQKQKHIYSHVHLQAHTQTLVDLTK